MGPCFGLARVAESVDAAVFQTAGHGGHVGSIPTVRTFFAILSKGWNSQSNNMLLYDNRRSQAFPALLTLFTAFLAFLWLAGGASKKKWPHSLRQFRGVS